MSNPEDGLSRRSVLKTSASGAIGGLIVGGATSDDIAAAEPAANQSVYAKLGIKTIINAAGTITTMGGSLMPPEVVEAWQSASKGFVNLIELQDRVGERIAKLLKVPAALVTTGAAGAIMIGTAGVVTHRDPSLVRRLPLPPQMGIEVIRQTSHRASYDHQVMASGVKLVDVETRQDLEKAINKKTAMMLSYNFLERAGKIKRREWIAVAKKHNIPTLLDAAADVPPVERLWEYNQMGYDLVIFSGGKGLLGPQDTGLLLGRKDLIEAAKLNTAPYSSNLGRGLKVSKEDMVAMWAAVERFVKLDHKAQQKKWEGMIQVVSKSIADIPSVKTRTVTPPIANHVPHLVITWDESKVRIKPGQVKQKLAQGDPSILTARVHGTGSEGFLISVFVLQPGEDAIVGNRLKSVLRAAQV